MRSLELTSWLEALTIKSSKIIRKLIRFINRNFRVLEIFEKQNVFFIALEQAAAMQRILFGSALAFIRSHGPDNHDFFGH